MRLTALIIILILLTAVMLIPIGVYASYADGNFTASVHAWFYKLSLYPPKEKKPKPEPEESTEADAEKEEKPEKSFSLDFSLNDWLELARVALSALRRLKNGVYFDFIRLSAVISAPDPYDAVMRYNAVNGFVGSTIPFFESEFRVKEKEIYIGLDMNGGESGASFELSASVRVGTILALGFAAGFGFSKILIKNRIRRIRERVARNGEQQTERNDAVDHEQHQGSC